MSNVYVISTGRNSSKYVKNCIDSVQKQTLQPIEHVLIDDISDDDTRGHLMTYLHNPEYANLNIIFNKVRKYRLLNLYENIVNKKPDDIICIVDSDDWLAHDRVLETILDVYNNNPKLEYVYSNYKLANGTLGASEAIPSRHWDPYANRWITSHMCTIKAKALQRIPKSNFLNWDKKWFEIATDHALILPVIYNLKHIHGDYSAIEFLNEAMYVHKFFGNSSKPRTGTTEANNRSEMAVRCSTYIKQRGFVE
tara:strand:+ start:5703 stop:6458 length:756 start_codon:yes stop_codon:yes gene_type:complete